MLIYAFGRDGVHTGGKKENKRPDPAPHFTVVPLYGGVIHVHCFDQVRFSTHLQA